MNDLDELTQYLEQRAAVADLGHTPVGVITRAGSRRRHRQRVLTSGAVLAAGALSAVATVQLTRDGDRGRRISTDVNPPVSTEAPNTSTTPGPVDATTAVPPVQPPGLVWNAVEVGSAESLSTLSWITDTASNAELGPYYRAATAPGRSTGEVPGFYRSEDGVRWEHLGDADPNRPDALFVGRSVGSYAGTRYVVSTEFVERGSGPATPTVWISDDGDAWRDEPLPFDLAGLAAEPGVSRLNLSPGGVAGQGSMVVVGAVLHTGVDAESVGELIGAPGSVDSTGSGFVQYATSPIDCAEYHRLFTEWLDSTGAMEAGGDPSPMPPRPGARLRSGECVRWGEPIREIRPADLGLSEDAVAGALGAPLLFASSGGEAFVRVAAPRPPAGEFVSRFGILAEGDGYVGVLATNNAIRAYRSDAALSEWTEVAAVMAETNDSNMIGAIGSAAGNAVVISQSGHDGSAAVHTLQGDRWITTNVAALVPDRAFTLWSQGAVGSNGVGLVGTDYPPQEGRPPVLVFSPDGLTWQTIDLGTLTDMDGNLVTGLMFTGDRVLVTVRAMTDLENRDAPLPGSTVLVGTPGVSYWKVARASV